MINGPVAGQLVEFTVTGGVLTSVTNGDGTNGVVDAGGATGRGWTDTNGDIYIYVSRETPGQVTVAAHLDEPCGLPLDRTFTAEFVAPVYVLFCIDATGSTADGAVIGTGVKATVDYLYTHIHDQGGHLQVAAIKFSDTYANLLDPSMPYTNGIMRDFAIMADTNAVTAFKDWVDQPAPPYGGYEYQLDILMFAKDMVPDAGSGLYIALATDEDSDSEPRLLRPDVASQLAQAGCTVFIDPADESLVSYYQPLAVNGGAVEIGSLNTFQFPLMRQSILGTH